MTVRARVTVYPRREILDPQGKAIAGALERLGFDRVLDVRAGKSFEIVLSDNGSSVEDELSQISEKLLANTLIEDYSVELLESDSK
ncbi:MAG: phosphoribosylformylglycinamidine synthase subunit PurS [Acidobacteriota bacterium]